MSDETKIRALEIPNNVREKLEGALAECDEWEGVMIVALRKDGGQRLLTSSMFGRDKMFLAQYVAAWAASEFQMARCPHD